jgi:hypothetical protein
LYPGWALTYSGNNKHYGSRNGCCNDSLGIANETQNDGADPDERDHPEDIERENEKV